MCVGPRGDRGSGRGLPLHLREREGCVRRPNGHPRRLSRRLEVDTGNRSAEGLDEPHDVIGGVADAPREGRVVRVVHAHEEAPDGRRRLLLTVEGPTEGRLRPRLLDVHGRRRPARRVYVRGGRVHPPVTPSLRRVRRRTEVSRSNS